MNTSFKTALNKIEADDELLEKTKKYLHENLDNPTQEKIAYLRKRSVTQMSRLIAACATIILAISLLIGGITYLRTPVAFISIDINPSVEIGLNALNKVVTVEGVNEDGRTLIEGQNIINTNISDAIDKLVNTAAEKEYIKDDGSTVISIVAESKNEEKAADLTEISEKAVNNTIKRNNFKKVLVYKDCSDLSFRTEAKEQGISPGKYKLIKSVQELDPSVSIDELKNSNVSDIMSKAKEIINELDVENEELELSDEQKETIEKIKNITNKEKEDKKVKEQVREQFKEAKKEIKDAFEEAKKEAKNIREDAKSKAKDLKEQAKALKKSTKGMSEEEKSEIIAKADELKKQAEDLLREASKKAEDFMKSAEEKKDEAIETAEKLKDKKLKDNVKGNKKARGKKN